MKHHRKNICKSAIVWESIEVACYKGFPLWMSLLVSKQLNQKNFGSIWFLHEGIPINYDIDGAKFENTDNNWTGKVKYKIN